jgi:hypothetical protein
VVGVLVPLEITALLAGLAVVHLVGQGLLEELELRVKDF